jgi:hypothetical protein
MIDCLFDFENLWISKSLANMIICIIVGLFQLIFISVVGKSFFFIEVKSIFLAFYFETIIFYVDQAMNLVACRNIEDLSLLDSDFSVIINNL